MLYRALLVIILIIFVFSCKSIKIKDQETYGNVLFKNLKKKSAKVNDASINGIFKISGIEEIPQIFMEFQLVSKFNDKYVSFRIKALNKNLIDIIINNNEVYIINNIEKKYYKTDVEKIDFSKVTGINFNPLDISYFFVGVIPNSSKMELIDFKKDKNDYVLDISDTNSKYNITINNKELMTKVKVFNQYFDTFTLESIRYKENNAAAIPAPHMFVFASEDKKIKISFIINKVQLNLSGINPIDLKKVISENKSAEKIEEIKIDMEKFKNQLKN